ncbi:MAG: hypothetical protein FWC46_05560 [Actinomycetia bacterium]|nr:hypothetical protein [Actinomycetes bacterium]
MSRNAADGGVAAPFLKHLADETAPYGLDLRWAESSQPAFGYDDLPRVDVIAGANVVTCWFCDDASVWMQASVVPDWYVTRFDTWALNLRPDALDFRLLAALLAGDARLNGRLSPKGPTLVVTRDGESLVLSVHTETPLLADNPELKTRRIMDALVRRLTRKAAEADLAIVCTQTSGSAMGQQDVPQLDVTVGPNTVTLWPKDEWLVWVRASVVPDACVRRIETVETEVDPDDACLGLLVGLLAGEGRLTHRRLRSDVLDIRQPDAWLRFELRDVRPTLFERVWFFSPAGRTPATPATDPTVSPVGGG